MRILGQFIIGAMVSTAMCISLQGCGGAVQEIATGVATHAAMSKGEDIVKTVDIEESKEQLQERIDLLQEGIDSATEKYTTMIEQAEATAASLPPGTWLHNKAMNGIETMESALDLIVEPLREKLELLQDQLDSEVVEVDNNTIEITEDTPNEPTL